MFFFIPWKTVGARTLGLLVFVLLQVGIGTTLRMGLFPFVMTAGLIPFLRAGFWSAVLPGPSSSVRTPQATTRFELKSWTRFTRFARAVSCVWLLLSNINGVLPQPFFPPSVRVLESRLGFKQSWAMYAPDPYAFNFGLAVSLELQDGTAVVLNDGRGHRTWGLLDQIWDDHRGAMYLETISDGDTRNRLSDLGHWIHRRWRPAQGRPSGIERVRFELTEWEHGHPDEVSRHHLGDLDF
ncbi:MAG: hypothetical protein VX815_12900 [Gemmatimonadota bacterium]|nr:hypothetical protein [Gemmatimonadota bacterium]